MKTTKTITKMFARILAIALTITGITSIVGTSAAGSVWTFNKDETSKSYYWGLISYYQNPAHARDQIMKHKAEIIQLSEGEKNNLDFLRDGKLDMRDAVVAQRLAKTKMFTLNGKQYSYKLKNPMQLNSTVLSRIKSLISKTQTYGQISLYDFDKSGKIDKNDLALAEEFSSISTWHSMLGSDFSINDTDSMVQFALDWDLADRMQIYKVSKISEIKGDQAVIIYNGEVCLLKHDVYGETWVVSAPITKTTGRVRAFISEFSGYCITVAK